MFYSNGVVSIRGIGFVTKYLSLVINKMIQSTFNTYNQIEKQSILCSKHKTEHPLFCTE